MTILVTGGAGFIGAYVVRALTEQGHDVVIYDNFSEFLYTRQYKQDRLSTLLPDFPAEQLVEADVTDIQALQHVFSRWSFDLVIHLAALANPGKSVKHAAEYTHVNVEGTKALLAAVSQAKCSRLIFAGSSSVYNDEVVPFREDEGNLRPRSPYGQSKAHAEELLKAWQQEQGNRKLTILRFFSVYGPWGRPDMAPMIFAQRILSGETIELNAEERKRDFTYIDDTVAGIMAAVEKPFASEIINLGRGEPTTVRDFVAAIEQAAGKKAQIVPRDTPESEMYITYADISKAERLLGYNPKVSVKEGTALFVQWLGEYLQHS